MPPNARFNFVALAGDPEAPEVCHLRVTQHLQNELSAEFQRQLEAFNLDGCDRINYGRNPQYKLDEGELFEIPDFELPASIAALHSAPDLPPLSDELIERGSIRALVGVRSGSHQALCFQAIDTRQLLRRVRFSILLSQDTFERNAHNGLVIRTELSAVYRDGTLYFPHEAPVRRFLDLTPVFTQATDHQVRAFLRNNVFEVADPDAALAMADRWTRRKITSIEKRGVLRELDPRKVERVGREFGLHVTVRRAQGNHVLVVPANKREFKELLRLLDQDYLASSLTSDRFRANSKLPVSIPRG